MSTQVDNPIESKFVEIPEVCPLFTRQRGADQLVRMNFSPIMGRRDAAYDYAHKMLEHPFEKFSVKERYYHYERIVKILNGVIDDTMFILSIFTSPDTIKRENALLSHFHLLVSNVKTLLSLAEMNVIIVEQTGKLSSLEDLTPGPVLVKENTLPSDCEELLINQIRHFFTSSSKRLKRYRSYVYASFSEDYRTRYDKASLAYHKLLESENKPN